MPFDEFSCPKCGKFDIRRSIHDDPLPECPCPQCNQASPRQLSTFSHRMSGPKPAAENVKREKEAERLYGDRQAAYDKESKVKIPGQDMPPLEEYPRTRDVLTSGAPGAPPRMRREVRKNIQRRKETRHRQTS